MILQIVVYEKYKIKHATFGRILTNVPGFVSKPMSIRTFPGTFALILRKVAGTFFGKMVLQIVVYETYKIKHATFRRYIMTIVGIMSVNVCKGRGPSLIVNTPWRQKLSVAYCEHPNVRAHAFGESVAYSDFSSNLSEDGNPVCT